MRKSEKRQSKRNKLLLLLGVLIAITILFLIGENLLPDGWYYVPSGAIKIAFLLCVLWECIIMIVAYLLLKKIKTFLNDRDKKIAKTAMVLAALFLALFFALNLFGYWWKLEEKEEQYDEHIALYVKNTFVRPEFRNPNYRYEENWLFMRNLSDDELNEAILKYGNPDDYYN